MKNLFLVMVLFMMTAAQAQQLAKPSAAEIATLPEWAQKMYADDPVVYEVDSLYNAYYKSAPFIKSYHTQYYKIWRRKIAPYISDDGKVRKPAPDGYRSFSSNRSVQLSPWTLVGPEKVWGEDGSRQGQQTNVYSITQCQTHPNVLYCGTEPGEIYRSFDAGMNWILVTMNEPLDGGVTAVCVDPNDSARVFAGSGDFIFVSDDAGNTWNISYSQTGLGVNELLVHPADPNIVLAATEKGLFKSTDGGQNWNQIFTQKCWDIKLRPGTSNVVYLLKNNPLQNICEFWLSADTASTFNLQTTGWYSSNDPARYDGGARLAVSPADPLRVYAYLIGDSKPNDYGYIGIYRSNDGGQTWSLPNGPAGGPYTASHPNLAYGNTNWTYHQGFYNCAIMANPADANQLLIGGLNLWRSNDGGATFSSVAGYVGGPLDMHVDMQDFRVGVNGVWITNDGGIYYSTDFFSSDNQIRMDGVHGSEFWGFGHGWNEDVMVGGLYHNGTVAYYQNYPVREFLQLGGAEPASGYVNPGENRRVYSSDIGGAVIPQMIGQPIGRFGVGMWPNESYWTAESSEMKFDPRCYNIIWIGKDHQLYRSVDGGASYNLVYTFGTNSNSKISYFEICRSNPDVMYVVQRSGKLWKTTDAGATWTQLTIPSGNSNRIVLSVSATDEDSLWIGYPSGANGQKVFMTGNGGLTWTNLTTTDLNNQEVRSLLAVGATNGGVYYITNTSVYYRNNSMSNWMADNTGLPVYMNSLYARPFYRDGKIRVSTYGRGVWENVLNDQPVHPVAQPMVDKLNYVMNCEADSFYFEDYSILNHTGASWQWSFPGGNPSSSVLRNPVVYYSTPGVYTVTLVVTDGNNQSDTGSLVITVSAYQQNTNLVEGFQTQFPPNGWWSENPDNGPQWSMSTQAGGYGNSTQSAIFDNYNFDSQGNSDYLSIRADMTQQPTQQLKFDYAYAEYGFPYSDTLEVVISTDCGQTYSTLWRKGGSQLATAPQETGQTFVPTASQWRTDSVDLSAYSSNTDLLIAFKNIGFWGQAVYVDNINLSAPLSTEEPVAQTLYAEVYPNPLLKGQSLTLLTSSEEAVTFTLYTAEGQKVLEQRVKNKEQIDTSALSAGVYFWMITESGFIKNGKLIVAEGRKR